jgi:tetratricopeptide (TPR) repeat protein
LRIVLSGRFAVLARDIGDVTPVGAKSQALLALLAASPDRTRTRRWLAEKLWSDRGPEQASGSLRQALTDIRAALGCHSGVLGADRQKVWLDVGRVTIEATEAPTPEFLEGIAVRDPEFGVWLRVERLRRQTPRPMDPGMAADGPLHQGMTPTLRRGTAARPLVIMLRSQPASDALALLEDLLIDCVSLSLREALGLHVYSRRPSQLPQRWIEVSVQAFVTGTGKRGLRVRASEGETGRLLWTGGSAPLPASGPIADDLETILFANQVVEALGDALTLVPAAGVPNDALALQRLAMRKMWTMQSGRMAEAEALFALADQMEPRGVIKAWQAQLRVFRMIERHDGTDPAMRDEALELCAQAMEREPNNSMVLAVVAYARNALDRDALASVELAKRSVRINPVNPVAWDSLSIAKLYSGHLAEAHEIAQRVQKMGAMRPNRFWWDMGLCVTAALTGNESLALQMARSASAQAPDFRAALRYIVALSAARDMPEAALAAAERLRRLEPAFTFDALAHDPAYPVGALRRGGLLQSDRIRAIGP